MAIEKINGIVLTPNEHGSDKHQVVASDTLQHSNDAEKTTASTTYVKLKEMRLNIDLNACRLKFDLKGSGFNGTTGYATVYKNGGAIGTEQSQADGGYVTKSEDFTNWSKDDLIQIYVRTPAATAGVENMRIYYDISATKTAPTNQDP